MERAALVKQIDARLGNRELVWFGTRNDDALSLSDIPQLSASFALIGTFAGRPSVRSLALEEIDGRRVDLDMFDLDRRLRDPAVAELRSILLRSLARPSALVTYRPTTFLSAITFARHDRCQYFGLFKGHQDAFEHKPWLETSLASLGVPSVPWRYVPDIEFLETRELLDRGPVMLRRSRTSGGVGFTRVAEPSDLEALWPDEEEAYVSVAPYLDDVQPLNVSAVVWNDGITVHPASVQLIGLPEVTNRPFGYCGNDFGAAKQLEPSILEQVDLNTRLIGAWLQGFGYRGAFGVDFLVKAGAALFMEVNARLQGSTHLSCQISVELGESCLLTEHLAALMGLPAPPGRGLVELMRDVLPRAHLVLHHLGDAEVGVDPGPMVSAFRRLESFDRVDVLTRADLTTETNAATARITVRDVVTSTGFDLREPYRSAAQRQPPS